MNSVLKSWPLPRLIAEILIVAGVGLVPQPFYAAQSSTPVTVNPVQKPFVMRPGVVVDAGKGVLYMMNPQGGIDAVEIGSGKLQWASKAAAKPLTTFGDRLVAEAEPSGSQGLPIILLNTTTGKADGAKIEIPTPMGVIPAIVSAHGSSSVTATRIEAQVLLVRWSVTTIEVSGIQMAGPKPERTDTGAGLVDLRTRKVTPLSTDKASAMLLRSQPPVKRPRLSGGEQLYFPPKQVGEFFVSLKLGPASTGTPVTLKRWSAQDGAAMPDVYLGHGYAAWAVSADDQQFLLTRTIGGNRAGSIDYRWSLYAIATGTHTADLKLGQAATHFFLQGWELVYLSLPTARHGATGWRRTPLTIRALNTATMKEIWTRPLREAGYPPPLIPQS